MLNYKRYKQLKARRNDLLIYMKSDKRRIKEAQSINAYFLVSSITLRRNAEIKELNYITEILKMHKILWKQHLTNQPKPKKIILGAIDNIITCGICSQNCGNDWCCTVKND